MYSNLETFFTDADHAVNDFNAWSKRHLPQAAADHICYKCDNTAEFEQLRKLFEADSTFIYQSIISKRRIAIIRFTKPLVTDLGDVWLLELSDQKPDGSQMSGFDHFEIYPTTGPLENLAQDLITKGVDLEKIERPHHTTFDGQITPSLKIRLEPEPLLVKIKAEEMV
ncbi:MAG: VOC family protein [Candidatus Uhrbacteria bacterium]|nr:VOC family protein [Candidatus Uhrbacteria bacterium]